MQQILRGLAAQLDPKLPSVLLSHISLDVAEPGAERGIMAGRDIVIPLSAIPEEFTFTALGHVHYAQDFGSFGRPNVFYCGSTDRIDFGEENQFKSYVIMDTEAGTWDRVAIPCREYVTVPVVFEEGEFRVGSDLENVKDSICRLTYQRPDNEKPDYPWFEQMVWNAGAWDYRGYSEDVQRVASIRSEEIVHAVSVGELIRVWHSSKSSDAPLDELVAAGEELERTCAV
jgi:DNA repair exonuclease SbcCD nuclease subunit